MAFPSDCWRWGVCRHQVKSCILGFYAAFFCRYLSSPCRWAQAGARGHQGERACCVCPRCPVPCRQPPPPAASLLVPGVTQSPEHQACFCLPSLLQHSRAPGGEAHAHKQGLCNLPTATAGVTGDTSRGCTSLCRVPAAHHLLFFRGGSGGCRRASLEHLVLPPCTPLGRPCSEESWAGAGLVLGAAWGHQGGIAHQEMSPAVLMVCLSCSVMLPPPAQRLQGAVPFPPGHRSSCSWMHMWDGFSQSVVTAFIYLFIYIKASCALL